MLHDYSRTKKDSKIIEVYTQIAMQSTGRSQIMFTVEICASGGYPKNRWLHVFAVQTSAFYWRSWLICVCVLIAWQLSTFCYVIFGLLLLHPK